MAANPLPGQTLAVHPPLAVGWHSFLAGTWPADVYGLVAAVCAWSAFLALGRALVRGPRRRLFWIYPPAGTAGPGSSGPAA